MPSRKGTSEKRPAPVAVWIPSDEEGITLSDLFAPETPRDLISRARVDFLNGALDAKIDAETRAAALVERQQRPGRVRWSRERTRTAAIAVIDEKVRSGEWVSLTHQEISDAILARLGLTVKRGSMFGPEWVGDQLRARGCRKRPRRTKAAR